MQYKKILLSKYNQVNNIKRPAEITSNFLENSMIELITSLEAKKNRCKSKNELAVLEGRIADTRKHFNLIINAA